MISKKRIFLGTAIIRSWNDACNLVKFYRSPIFSRAYRRDVAARSLHTPVFSQSMRASYRSRIKNKVSKFEQKELLFLNGKKGATALFSVRFESSESRLKRFEFDRFLGNETWVVVRRIREGTVVKTFMKKEGEWVLCSPTTSSRSIFRVRTINARNRYRFLE